MMQRAIYLLITTIVLSGCMWTTQSGVKRTVMLGSEINEAPNSIPDTITIWIHGTLAGDLLHYFHSSPKGLMSWNDLNPHYRLRDVGIILEKYDPLNFSRTTFYTFGWSGKLNFEERKQAGLDFFDAVKAARTMHKNRFGVLPKVRVITHSHGGNVALNYPEEKNGQQACPIDELILLACPVQNATVSKADSRVFESIYSLYSRIDMIQKMDPQGLYKENKGQTEFFSERRFPNGKIIQAEISYDIRSLWHLDFITNSFVRVLPAILREIRQSKSKPEPIISDFAIKIID